MNKRQAKEICVGDIMECKSESSSGLRYFIVTEKCNNGNDVFYMGYYCSPNPDVLFHKEFEKISGRIPHLIDRGEANNKCVWKQDGKEFNWKLFDSTCGKTTDCQRVKIESFKFCPYCGKEIIVK